MDIHVRRLEKMTDESELLRKPSSIQLTGQTGVPAENNVNLSGIERSRRARMSIVLGSVQTTNQRHHRDYRLGFYFGNRDAIPRIQASRPSPLVITFLFVCTMDILVRRLEKMSGGDASVDGAVAVKRFR